MRRAISAAIFIIWLWPPTVDAEADEETRTEAQRLFRVGVEAARDGDLEAAINAFAASHELRPHPGTLYNIGAYQLEAGRRVEAYRTLSELLRTYGEVISDGAREDVGQRIAEIEEVMAILSVRSTPTEDAALRVDGEPVGETPLDGPLVLEPGTVTIEARLDGYEIATAVVELRPGTNPPVELSLSLLSSSPTLFIETEIDAMVSLDGGSSEPTPLRRELEPGEHTVRVEAPGYLPEDRNVQIPESGEVHLLVELVPEEDDRDDGIGSRRRRFLRRGLPWVLVATALTAVAASVTGVVVTKRNEPDGIVRVR